VIYIPVTNTLPRTISIMAIVRLLRSLREAKIFDIITYPLSNLLQDHEKSLVIVSLLIDEKFLDEAARPWLHFSEVVRPFDFLALFPTVFFIPLPDLLLIVV